VAEPVETSASWRLRSELVRDHVGSHGLFAGLRGSDLCLRLIDAGEGAFDARVLQRALTPVVFERRRRRLERRGGLCDLRAEIVVRQQHQLISFTNG
jgi:hypothetical protein